MKILLLMGSALVPALCPAQSCSSRFEFAFADGSRGCLSNVAFADEQVVGNFSSVRQLTPKQGMYSIAISIRTTGCPQVVAMEFARGGPGTNNGTTGEQTPVRSQAALNACESKLAESKTASSACSCKLIIENAVSSLSQEAFSKFAGKNAN